MSKFTAIPSDKFKKRMKLLRKSYRSIESDVDKVVQLLIENPRQGILIKENTYKIRLAITAKGRGKSGGARIITYVIDENDVLLLVDIYDKSEQENISDKEIEEIIDDFLDNFNNSDEGK